MRIDENGRYYLIEEEKEKLREKAKGRSLAEMNPELAAQWHGEKNGDLDSSMVTCGSGLKIWWKLPYLDENTGKFFVFEWQAKIQNRTNGGECPFLINNAHVWQGFNDLATINPQLALQWHPFKNGNLKPTDVTVGSNKKVWWYLPYDDSTTGKHFDFEWQAIICSRNEGIGCPFLSHQALWTGFNDLETLFPELAKEWHPIRNGILTPKDVMAHCGQKVWWIYHYDDSKTGKHFEFEWQATIASRASGKGCPFLSGQALWIGFNDLATTNPVLALQWHATKNGDLKPTDIMAGSRKKVWWQIKHPKTNELLEWEATVDSRNRGEGCPYLQLSKGEELLKEILNRNQIRFIEQSPIKVFSFKQCLRFDFYLNDFNIAIEYDGIQHVRKNKQFKHGDKFKRVVERDNAKTNYCHTNHIALLRIPHIYNPQKHKTKIEQFVLDFIQTKQVPREIIDFYSQFPFSDYGKILQKQTP